MTQRKLTKARMTQFCKALEGPPPLTIKAAAGVVGVHHDTVAEYYRSKGRHFDPAFAEKVSNALGASEAYAIAEAWKRATKGFVREVVDKRGDVREVIDAPSDRLLELLLRARNPEVFANHSRIEHSGQLTLSDAAEGELSAMSLEQLDKLAGMVDRSRAMLIDRDPQAKLEADRARGQRIRELREALGKQEALPSPRTMAERVMTAAEHVVDAKVEPTSETDVERAARPMAASPLAEHDTGSDQ